MKKIAIVLIRSAIKSTTQVKDTLRILGLSRKNACVIIFDTPEKLGMLKKVKDYVTWGFVDDELVASLKLKRGVAFLHPPRGGFERKGIKISFSAGGALGARGERMSELLRRMLP